MRTSQFFTLFVIAFVGFGFFFVTVDAYQELAQHAIRFVAGLLTGVVTFTFFFVLLADMIISGVARKLKEDK